MLINAVAPFAGAWIEMELKQVDSKPYTVSLPSRERGLKFWIFRSTKQGKRVAPFAGAWIEISTTRSTTRSNLVAPFAGAWIEIFTDNVPYLRCHMVAPFAGAWIEIAALYL